jgi:hypothetical protein
MPLYLQKNFMLSLVVFQGGILLKQQATIKHKLLSR